jgi:hypothetical protein
MNHSDDFFARMCREAQEELASGKKGWKEADTNTLVLACFGMLSNHLTSKLAKPLWFFASSVCAAVIGYIVKLVLGG